jgi:hypothetical protein
VDDDSEDLKARIQELEDELQKLKDKKRQQYSDSAAVDEETEEVHDQIRDEADHSGMSRRKFMKTLAGGGAALGAAAMMPSAAALDIESTNPLNYNESFSVDTQGNLDLQGHNIANAGSIGATSIETDKQNNNAHWVQGGDAEAISQTIENANSGDLIYVPAGTYNVNNPPLDIDTKVHLFAWGHATLRLADGLDEDADSVIRFLNGASGSTFEGFEIDGNYENQDVPEFGDDNPGAHGLYVGHAGTDEFAVNITVRNCYIHDTIRSGLVGNSKDSVYKNLKIKNATHDHWIYAAAFIDCHVKNVICEGYARGSGIVLGTGSRKCFGNTFSDITIKNIETNPYDSGMGNMIYFRDVDEAYGNTVKDVELYTSNYGASVNRIQIGHPDATLKDVDWIASDSGQPIIYTRFNGDDATIKNVNVTVGGNNNNKNTVIFRIATDGVTVDKCYAGEDGVSSLNNRGYSVSGNDATITNSVSDVGFYSMVIDGAKRLWTMNFRHRDSSTVVTSGDPSWAENGYAEESADAEEPQKDYPYGTIVDFTDTGDDSGTGKYLITRANGPVEI